MQKVRLSELFSSWMGDYMRLSPFASITIGDRVISLEKRDPEIDMELLRFYTSKKLGVEMVFVELSSITDQIPVEFDK